MIKNIILVPIHENPQYTWFSLYLENENGKINIFNPVDDSTFDWKPLPEWEEFYKKFDNKPAPMFAFKCYSRYNIGIDKFKCKIMDTWPGVPIYCLDGGFVSPVKRDREGGYGFDN